MIIYGVCLKHQGPTLAGILNILIRIKRTCLHFITVLVHSQLLSTKSINQYPINSVCVYLDHWDNPLISAAYEHLFALLIETFSNVSFFVSYEKESLYALILDY